jgi:predicted RNA-binding protein YlxR (DUF448 family)
MRRCAGCGRRAPQHELLRFAAGRTEPGRGVYTCRSLACFDRAASSGMLVRVLQQQVRIGPELRRLYTGEDDG